jgi:hypothetical protein
VGKLIVSWYVWNNQHVVYKPRIAVFCRRLCIISKTKTHRTAVVALVDVDVSESAWRRRRAKGADAGA